MRVGEGRTAEIVMMQSEVRAKLGDFKVTFDKGSYPQPRTSVIQGIEIFKVKYQLFLHWERLHLSMTSTWNLYTLFTINFAAINFGYNIFGGINFGEISTIHRISIEIRSMKIFGVANFRLSTSSPKLFHTEIYRKFIVTVTFGNSKSGPVSYEINNLSL